MELPVSIILFEHIQSDLIRGVEISSKISEGALYWGAFECDINDQ